MSAEFHVERTFFCRAEDSEAYHNLSRSAPLIVYIQWLRRLSRILTLPLESAPGGGYKDPVIALAISRWAILRALREPLIWVGWLLFLAALPVLRHLQGLPPSVDATQLVTTWAFPAGLVGATAALNALSRNEVFLFRLEPTARWASELCALLGATASLQVPILLGALLSGTSPSDVGLLLPAILTADLHLGSIAVLLLIPASRPAARMTFLLAGVWLVPALCASHAGLARIAGVLDAGAALRAPCDARLLFAGLAAAAAALTAYLARTGSSRGAAR